MAIQVFLDMDGVVADFVAGIHRAMGLDYSHNVYHYTPGKYDIFEAMCERSGNKFSVKDIIRAGDAAEFWENLEWEPMGKQVLAAVKETVGVENITVCTAPMTHPLAWSGKIAWLKKYTPELKKVVITSAPKHYLAKKGHILIDDKDSNCDDFEKAGGQAFLVPQPWNSARLMYGVDYIPALKNFLSKQNKKSLWSIWE